MLASLLYPYDDDAPKQIERWLGELEQEGCIVRYMVDGTSYLQICKWLSHQKIDKPSKSKFPAFDESSRILANPREVSATDQGSGPGPRTKDLDQGKDQGSGPSSVEQQADRPVDSSVQQVFSHWQQTMNHKRSVLDSKREKLIKARLKDGYSVSDLCNAITGCSNSPFHMGVNEQGVRYDGLDLILRDAAKVDSFLAKFHTPPSAMGKQGVLEARNRVIGDEFVNGPNPWESVAPRQQGDFIDME